MPTESRSESWSDGEAYEAYVGRWSRLVAPRFLAWLAALDGGRWLDVGCGTGALSAAIAAACDPLEIVGVDASQTYAEEARRRVGDPRARFEQGDAGSLRYDGLFDAAVSGLVLNFVEHPAAAVGGMTHAVVPGGIVAAYVWDYAGGMQMMRAFWDAAAALDDAARALDEAVRFRLCEPEELAALWHEAGLDAVETTPIEVATPFRDFDDYWAPFLGGQGSAPGYVTTLAQPQRDALRDALRASLPIAVDGSISMVARAWAVKGWRGR